MFDAPVVNIPVGDHGKRDIARVLYEVPRAIHRHGRPDVVHGLWANLPGLAAVVAATRCRVPSVVSVCGGELATVPAIGYGGGTRTGTRRLALLALRGATSTTVATEWMRQHVRAAGGRVDEVIPLGADLTHCTVDPDVPARPQHLVHLGGRNLVKDQDLLLRGFALALAEEPRLTLAIAGGDTLGGQHERLAAELGVAHRVEFLGHVPHDQLGPVLTGAALHVLTSFHDAGPVAVLEAAACGVPTIGTAVGHVADFAGMHPPAAVTVADRRPATLAAGIIQLLADRPQRNALARSAQTWAEQHDAAFTATAFEQLYCRLVARSASA
jgi:glycosyltransferase involved in cell wall biosynthesis